MLPTLPYPAPCPILNTCYPAPPSLHPAPPFSLPAQPSTLPHLPCTLQEIKEVELSDSLEVGLG